MAAEPDLVSARLALRWLILGEVRAHPARFLVTVIAIAVGVALGFAVHLVNGSALASFDGAMRSVNGAADLSVRAASPLGFDEGLYPEVMAADGVADASPVVSLDATATGADFTLLGLDVIRAASVTPSLIGQRPNGPDSGSAGLFDASALFLSRAALEATGASIGGELPVSAHGRTAVLTVAGVLAGVPAGQAVGVIDIAAAQWRFDRLGRLDRLDLKLADPATARSALAALLPADANLASTETEAAQGSALSRAYRVNLDMLALVALITGGFLVFSAQSLSVARRLRAFALVRTLGLPRRGIVAVVALEGLVIGVIGALAGLAVGYALASLALRFFGGDLGAGYFHGGDVHVVFQPIAAATFGALGVAAALLGSVLPARAASKAAPAAALKNSGDMLDPRKPVPWKPALVLMAAGGLSSFSPPVGQLPILGFAGMALILAGGVAGVPWLARQLLSPLARRGGSGVALPLAVRHVHGAPGAAATALCGIVASTALMIAMATMVTSFRGAVDDWLLQVLSADVYLRAESGDGFDPAVQARLAAVPGVAGIAFSRQIPLTLSPDRPPVTLIARPVDPASPEASMQLIETAPAATSRPDVAERSPSAASPSAAGGTGAQSAAAAATGDAEGPSAVTATPVWISEPAARLYGWQPGETIALPLGQGQPFRVAAVWRDYARQQGAIVIGSGDYQRLTGDVSRGEAAVTLAPGADADATGRALLTALPDTVRSGVSLARPSTLRRFALDLFDKSFAVTYVLEAVAILVGLAGVAATMSSQTLARVREFGMLRHLGLGKGQITAMLGIEGALLGAVGGLAGTGLGLILSQVLIHVINPQSFNWTMTTRLPLGTILGVVAALVLAAAGTAILAGWRANAMSAVLAVREDW